MKSFLFILSILSIPTCIFAQGIHGTISDENHEAVFAAEIVNITRGNHSHSDDMGDFFLEAVSPGDSISIFHMAYNSVTLAVSSLSYPLNIILTEKPLNLEEVVVFPRLNAISIISNIDIKIKPVNSSQDVLRQVPGLITGQHAGGGKAEQIFLRGFDLDHGTDINISADGIPVNMVSHSHGQGYADLHFIIPETIENIDFGKGPYYAGKGDLTTAGYVDFRTKNSIKNSMLSMEGGQFNSYRLLGMFKLLNTGRNKAYLASEYISTDGPFESPQNFNRINIFGKYSSRINDSDMLGVTLSHFTSSWDASGQIPQRAVESGLIGRFGAIDDTEGGNTSRTNLIFDFDKKISNKTSLSNKLYISRYDFELYSNFTFFLEDPVNGDQIRQKENRDMFGITSIYKHNFNIGRTKNTLKAGISLRNDRTEGSELSHTLDRSLNIESLQLGDINQTNLGTFISVSIEAGNWLFNPSLRADYFDFRYNDQITATYSTQSAGATTISPKLNILYNLSHDLQLYFKSGKGFHSNDIRVVIPENGKDILPAAWAYDLGMIWKPAKQLLINTAYWYLFMEQEFIYVGDAGIVEPGGKTARQGLDLSLRYQPKEWLFASLDAEYAHGRATEELPGEDHIPLALNFMISGSLNARLESGYYGGIHLRHINDRAANEDNSIIAPGYTVIDLNAGHNWKRLGLSLQVQNLLNTEWNETQFATESRLQFEPAPVEEIHFTPGTPFFIKARIDYKF